MVAAAAGWVEDDGLIFFEIIEGGFAFGENGLGRGADTVVLELAEGISVTLDQGKVFVARDREADGADAGVKV